MRFHIESTDVQGGYSLAEVHARIGGWYHLGIAVNPHSMFTGSFTMVCSYCVPMLALAVLPLFEIRHIVRWRRRQYRRLHRLCQGCGYDLRATPQRCPECGTVPP
jgi:hypothetical protein